LKTISQIAAEIGVSKQAIQKKISKEPLCTNIRQYITTIAGTKYIDETGEAMIKSAYQKLEQQPIADNIPTNQPTTTDKIYSEVYSVVKETIEALRGELEIKNRQLENKDKQIEELTATIRIQAESINADRHNELAETIIPQLTEEKKEGFFRRIFSKHRQ